MSTPADDAEAIMQLFLEKVQRTVRSRGYGGMKETERADEELKALETTSMNLERKIQQHIAGQRRRRNATLPIYQLPAEVLTRILFLALQEPMLEDKKALEDIQKLSTVSWWWSNLAESPSLYGVLTSFSSIHVQNRSISKSKTSPVDIKHIRSNDSFENRIFDHVHRWRSLEIDRPSSQFIQRVTASATPLLDDLQISHYDKVIHLSTAQLKPLRHLVIKGAGIRWDGIGGLSTRLKTLELECDKPEGFPSATQLFHALKASPGLVTLTLKLSKFSPSSDIDPGVVELMHLKSLTIRLPSPNAHNILTHIRIPSCTTLAVQSLSDQTMEPLGQSTNHLAAPIGFILSAGGGVCIQIYPWKVTLHTGLDVLTNRYQGSSKSLLALDIATGNPSLLLDWFIKIVEAVQPAPSIGLRIHSVDVEIVLPVLNTPCPIVSLSFTSINNSSGYMRLLSQPTTSNGITRWPLPEVTTIIFEQCNPRPKELLSMIRERYRSAAEADISEATLGKNREDKKARSEERPVSLDELRVTGRNRLRRRDFMELKGIVGDEKVIWEAPFESFQRSYRDYENGLNEDYDEDEDNF